MPTHKIYTTQSSLAATLAELFGSSWKGSEIVIPGSRHRWDMAYSEGSQIVVVEYDGDEHYRNSMKIKVDHEKDRAVASKGYRVIRFPYWVQLDTSTLWHYFKIKKELHTEFPHGFITTHLFPASFCELGVERFRSEIDRLPDDVKFAVVESLRERAKEHGIEYVVPSTLRYLIAA